MTPQYFATPALLLAGAIVATDRHIVRRLMGSGAVSADKAIPQPRHWNPLWAWRMHRMETGGAVKRVAAGGVYLDPVGYVAYRSARRRRALIALSIVIVIAAVLYYRQR